ncbi:hypothetical protein DIPPA_29113 [Diplonema papillatum]|nr:hypothetical protein DIPPA_29113 [Diplonema papillatum]
MFKVVSQVPRFPLTPQRAENNGSGIEPKTSASNRTSSITASTGALVDSDTSTAAAAEGQKPLGSGGNDIVTLPGKPDARSTQGACSPAPGRRETVSAARRQATSVSRSRAPSTEGCAHSAAAAACRRVQAREPA